MDLQVKHQIARIHQAHYTVCNCLGESDECCQPTCPCHPRDDALERVGQAFEDVLEELRNMHYRKQSDYGRDEDPYANVRGSEEWGVEAWVGALVRATDKLKRLQKAAQGGELANESVEDSLIDMAVYVIIALILYREGNYE